MPLQPYKSIGDLKVKHRLILPPPHQWYLLSPSECHTGEIHAIHAIRGQAVASNGILIALLTSADDIVIGHREWFEPDYINEENSGCRTGRSRSRTTQLQVVAKQEYI